MNANIKSATRREVYRRDGYRCALCDSSQGLQVHHVIPRGESAQIPRITSLPCAAIAIPTRMAARSTIRP